MVEVGYLVPGDGRIAIDLKNRTVTPGLTNMYVHIQSQSSKDNYSKSFRTNETDVVLAAIPYTEVTLMAGFTTVLDVGGNGANILLKSY
ncbi:MAG: hypothetical protein ACFB15_06105 [Cyclobacteriaceae bacterium]